MIVRFWGVRGSVPSPGQATVRVGGNTPCVSLETDAHTLILDAGTGIRALGEELFRTDSEITLLVSHCHWDHLMGLPFFAPLYEAGRRVHVIAPGAESQPGAALSVLDGVHFPKHHTELPAEIIEVREAADRFLAARGFELRTIALNHPGGATGFRISHQSRSFVYMTDNELDGPAGAGTPFQEFVEFCRAADVLCHDAQYVAGEMPHRWGWGHSHVARACDLAMQAEVGQLVLFHHDPARTDEQIEEMEGIARTLVSGSTVTCTAAFEGLEIDLS